MQLWDAASLSISSFFIIRENYNMNYLFLPEKEQNGADESSSLRIILFIPRD